MRHFFCGARVVSCVLIVLASASLAWGAADRRFDVATMDCTPDGNDPHFCQTQLDHLNFPTTNGHFIAMATDGQRPNINANGNYLAAYYNNLSGMYQTYPNATTAADVIENYVVANCTSNGSKPQWLVINEISGSSWPSNSGYRTWLIAVITRLNHHYSHKNILFSPFKNPGNHGSDWTALSSHCHIAIEGYLGGEAVNGSGNSVSWCQSQYQSYVNSYHNLGVPYGKIYLAEHYGQTTYGTGYGRSGASYSGWDAAIKARASAIHNIFQSGDIGGYISYGWGKNPKHVSETDMVHFEDTYASKVLP